MDPLDPNYRQGGTEPEYDPYLSDKLKYDPNYRPTEFTKEYPIFESAGKYGKLYNNGPSRYPNAKNGWNQPKAIRKMNVRKCSCAPGCGCGGGGGGRCGCGGYGGGSCGCGGGGYGGGGGGGGYGGKIICTKVSKQFLSRRSFNHIRSNLRKIRMLGVWLSIFAALLVALGIASLLFYHIGSNNNLPWCGDPYPILSPLNLALKSVAPSFNYATAACGLLGVFPLINGLMTSYLTKLYSNFAYADMYISFVSLAVLILIFLLSLMGFLMTFGYGGMTPSCQALSVTTFFAALLATVCSIIIYVIYYKANRFLNQLKADPSVDREMLKKYYGRKRITVVDDDYYDDDDDDDDDNDCGNGCCGGYCCEDEYDEDSSSDEEDQYGQYENAYAKPARNYPMVAHQQLPCPPRPLHHHAHHPPTHVHHPPTQVHHPSTHACQPQRLQCRPNYQVAGYPFARKQLYGHAHMATRFNPCAYGKNHQGWM